MKKELPENGIFGFQVLDDNEEVAVRFEVKFTPFGEGWMAAEVNEQGLYLGPAWVGSTLVGCWDNLLAAKPLALKSQEVMGRTMDALSACKKELQKHDEDNATA